MSVGSKKHIARRRLIAWGCKPLRAARGKADLLLMALRILRRVGLTFSFDGLTFSIDRRPAQVFCGAYLSLSKIFEPQVLKPNQQLSPEFIQKFLVHKFTKIPLWTPDGRSCSEHISRGIFDVSAFLRVLGLHSIVDSRDADCPTWNDSKERAVEREFMVGAPRPPWTEWPRFYRLCHRVAAFRSFT